MGGHGRSLRETVVVLSHGAHVQLRNKDRLELGGCIHDVYQNLTQLESYPATLRFFRASEAKLINGICPLLDDGVLKLQHIVPDVMHTFDLGITQQLFSI